MFCLRKVSKCCVARGEKYWWPPIYHTLFHHNHADVFVAWFWSQFFQYEHSYFVFIAPRPGYSWLTIYWLTSKSWFLWGFMPTFLRVGETENIIEKTKKLRQRDNWSSASWSSDNCSSDNWSFYIWSFDQWSLDNWSFDNLSSDNWSPDNWSLM